MRPRAILHVGSPKTGTTFLQDVLWRSRDAVAGSGIVLPLERPDHFRLAQALRGGADRTDRGSDDVLDRLRIALDGSRSDVLVSHELLSHALPERIDDLMEVLDRFEVHVVLTVRDYVRQVPSEWQQFVKTQHIATFHNFIGRIQVNPEHRFWDGQDYAAVLARWARHVPATQVHVVTVPPSGSPPTVLLDRFASVLGLDPALLGLDIPRRNVALGYEQAEVLRLVNRRLPAELLEQRPRYARVVKGWLAETVLSSQDGAPITLPHQHVAWCHAVAEQQIELVTRAGYDVVGDLGDLLPVVPADQAAPRASSADHLEVALDALVESVLQHERDRDRIAQLEQQLEQRVGHLEERRPRRRLFRS